MGRAKKKPKFSKTLGTQADSCCKSVSNTSQVWIPVKALENRNADQTHLQCAVVLHWKSMWMASHQPRIRTSLRHFMRDLPSGPSIKAWPLRASPAFRVFWFSPVRKGKSSPTRGPFPWQHSVSKAPPASISVGRSSIWSLAEMGSFLWGSATPSPQLCIRCSLERPRLIFRDGVGAFHVVRVALLSLLSESERRREKECRLFCRHLASQCATGHEMWQVHALIPSLSVNRITQMWVLILGSDTTSSNSRRKTEAAWLLRTSSNRKRFQRHPYPHLGNPEKLFSTRKTQASGVGHGLNALTPEKAHSTLKQQ